MRKLAAHYIFPSSGRPLKYGILILDDQGFVQNLIDTGGRLKEESNLEFYPGILCPGFVNAHCHLELSHMKGIIPEKTGMTGFIERISSDRKSGEEKINKAVLHYTSEIYRTGTSAVADIVNTSHTISAKQASQVLWHSFVELFSLEPHKAERVWRNGNELVKEFMTAGLTASLSPHAPYSLSVDLWKFFSKHPAEMLTIHNQESRDEDALMLKREGSLAEWFLARGYGFNSLLKATISSLDSYIDYLPKAKRVLFVHNTFSTRADFDLASSKLGSDRVFWVTCPNANLYITGLLPMELYRNHKGLQVCIGTDSLASNSNLSILQEMKTIQDNYPEIQLEELIKWATINGARALGIDNIYGSFEKGKKPGVVWINNISFPEPHLSQESRSKRLA